MCTKYVLFFKENPISLSIDNNKSTQYWNERRKVVAVGNGIFFLFGLCGQQKIRTHSLKYCKQIKATNTNSQNFRKS